jgi:hypothetical protein
MNVTSTDPQASNSDPAASEPAPAAGPGPAPKLGLKGKIAAGLLTVLLLGVGGFALTQMGDSSTASAASASQAGPGGGGGGFGGGRGAPASGTISAVSASSITVKTTTGTTTYQVSSSTVVQNNGATSTMAKLAVGEKVMVLTGRPGSTTTSTAGTTADRILAGTSATQNTGAGAGPNGAPAAGA